MADVTNFITRLEQINDELGDLAIMLLRESIESSSRKSSRHSRWHARRLRRLPRRKQFDNR
jgi:hypothetical protein